MVKRILILLCVLMVLPISDIVGRHIIGGEIYYDCLGDGSTPNTRRYAFTILMYRDCNGGGAEFDGDPNGNPQQTIPAASISIFSGTETNQRFITSFQLQLSRKSNVAPPDLPCLILPPNTCVEEGLYQFTVEFPVIDESYFVSYQRCCRNNTITNIRNPESTGATFTMELSEAAQDSCNSSPRFNLFPPTVVCVNEPVSFDHSAFDPDGDQIIYEFCAPLIGGGLGGLQGGDAEACNGVAPNPACEGPYDPVLYQIPLYSFRSPLGGDPVVNINGITGEIFGTPRALGQFVVGVCASEFRNGVLMSSLKRDFQFNVASCDPLVNAAIRSDEQIGDRSFLINSCGVSTIEFQNQSTDERVIDTYRWIFDVGNGNMQEAFTRDASITFPGLGTYDGIMYINENTTCEDSATIFVNLYPAIDADFTFDYDTCIAGPVEFTDMSMTGAEGGIQSYNWEFNNEGTTGIKDPNFQFPTPGLKNVTLSVTDRNSCEAISSKVVEWTPAPNTIVVEPSSFLGCKPANIFFNNLTEPIDESYDIQWTFGDGNTSTEISPTNLYEETGVYSVSLSITSPIGCSISEDFNSLIRVAEGPTADFSYTPTEVNSRNSTVFFQNQSRDEIAWFWNFAQLGFSAAENPNFTFRDTGLHEVQLIVTHQSGCQDTILQVIDVIPLVDWHMPNAFTPNNDGTNEEFRGRGGLFGANDFNFNIWNRWGELIFETTDPNQGWNGRKYNVGAMSPNGVYLYTVSYTGPRGEKEILEGFATLIR